MNVANLNTQEFYQGLQKPLTFDQVYYYLFSGFYDLNPSQLLPLFISEIDVNYGDGRKLVLRNRGDSLNKFFRFYNATNALLKKGLYMEANPKANPKKIGPELTVEQASDPKLLSALVSSASASSGGSSSSGSSGATSGGQADGGSGGFTLSPVTKKVDGKTVTTGYQLEKSGSTGTSGNYRFCFAGPRALPQGDEDLFETKPREEKSLTVYLGVEGGKYVWPVVIPPSLFCGHSPAKGPSLEGQRENTMKGIFFKTRSLEEIFYFLGEIVRTELGIANGEDTSLAIPDPSRPPFHFFHVERRLPAGEEPWVTLNGQIFSIRIDPSGSEDTSSRILQLMTDLLALQSSAKNLPAPNLIAITTP